MRVLISAGEASGEMYGAALIRALGRRVPGIEFFGVGGAAMRDAGCDVVVDAKHLSVVGITEIVSHLPRIYGEFRRLLREADRRRPDAAIVIDSPAFNFKVAQEMHARGVPVVYYVVPQLWAWRETRIARFRWIRKALVIFPFEEAWYRERGVDAEFVGHPLAEQPPPSIPREQYAAQHGLDAGKDWIALLPGSRKKEFGMNLPALLGAARQLGSGYQFIVPLAPGLDRAWAERRLAGSAVLPAADAWAALHFARAAVVASGTATVQAALAGVPFVIVYRVSALTWRLGRRLLRVPYVGMPNLIAGRQVVAELIQDRFTPENVVRELALLLAEGPARERMKQDLAEVRQKLAPPDAGAAQGGTPLPAAERAAEAALRALGR